ncbi:MAG: YfhO family protein [Lachnospiraceae bacterium]|nr:YfhO family protein [Lachnospiraceae bacterium]
MQIQIDRKKWLKNAVVLLAELVLILAGLVLVGTVGSRGFDNLNVYTTIFPQYQDMNKVLEGAHDLIASEDGNGYVTGKDTYFVIPVNSNKLIDLEMSRIEGEGMTGEIWQSENETFTEESSPYTFELGHNPVQARKSTKYIRVKISSQPGSHYNLTNVSYRNPFDVYMRIHKVDILKTAVALWMLCIILQCVQLIPPKQIKIQKMVTVIVYLGFVGITAIYIFHDFIWGEKLFLYMDIGSDTIQQYYPYYMNCVRRISEGTFSIWNWDYGLGTSLINNISQTLDPFGLFVILGGVVLGIGRVKRLLVVAQILKIILSALLCRYFLKLFRVSEKAACIGGYLYAFNGYLMLWGQHYLLGTICIYLLLILILLEKLIQEFKVRYVAGLGIVVTASIIYSYYNTYMALAFAAIYCVLRLLNPDLDLNLKDRIKRGCTILGSVICGVLAGAVTLLPAASYLTSSSSRLDSDVSALTKFLSGLFSSYPMEQNIETAGRLISNNLYYVNDYNYIKGWSNYYEMPNVCLTIFIYFFLGQLLVQSIKRCKSKGKAIYNIFVAVVGILMVFNPGVAIAFNGFAYAQARYTFVIMPIAALLVAVEWDRLMVEKEFSLIGLLLGLVASMYIVIKAYGRASAEVKNYDAELLILFIIFAVIMLVAGLWKKGTNQKIVGSLMIICIFLSTCMDNDITTNQRGMAYTWYEAIGYDDHHMTNDTIEALHYIEDRDDSFYRVDKTYTFLSTYGDSQVAGYSSVTDYNSTINRHLADFYNMLYTRVKVTDAQRIFVYSEESEVCPMSLINLKYILSMGEMDYSWCEYVGRTGGVYIYRNKYADSAASFYTNTISQSECAAMDETDRRMLLKDTLIVPDEQAALHETERGEVKLGDFVADGKYFTGTISNEKEGFLLLTIPDQDGWEVYVDGKKTETINGDYGFLAVKLTAGNHDVKAVYHIPYMKQGAVVSILGALLLTGYCLWLYHRDRKRKQG